MLRRIGIQIYMKSHQWSAALGEALGWEWLTYNHLVRYSFERAARRNAPKVVDAVLKEFPDLKTIADVGCGSGSYIAEFQKRGIRAVGCEYSAVSRKAAERKKVVVYPFDLSQSSDPLPGTPFDAALTVEVGEHIPSQLAMTFVHYLSAASDRIIFTAAQPGQGGPGHINEQPKSYWITKFASCGFEVDESASRKVADHLRSLQAFPYLFNNISIFVRSQPGTKIGQDPQLQRPPA